MREGGTSVVEVDGGMLLDRIWFSSVLSVIMTRRGVMYV